MSNLKYSVNEKYFNNINSEDKAYFLGLLFADGNNQIDKGRIKLMLQQSDVDIIEKFKTALNFDGQIYTTLDNRKGIVINNHILSNQLEKIGMVSNKTFKIKWPNIKKSLQPHFIRGYFDGDGCISSCSNGYKKENYQFNIVGRKNFLENIQNILIKNCKISKTKITKQGKIYRLDYSGNLQIKKIRTFLYKNASFFMHRKYNKFFKLGI